MARIFIIGSGVVGTATGKGFVRHGHDVTFVDIDHERLDALRQEGFTAVDTVDLPDVPAFVFLTLPTPNVGHRWDLSALTAGTCSVGEAIRSSDAFHTVVVRSTVPPGTTEGLVRKTLESCSGHRLGEGFALAAAPEFLRAASAVEDFLSPWMTVIGSRSRRTVERLEYLFRPYGGELRTFTNPASAELVKCAHNIFNATKISFWNEMWRVASLLHIEADAVANTVARSAEASFNAEYGIRGGAPYGGVCLPKDTKGFLGYAAEAGIDMPLLTAVVEVNDRMEKLLAREMAELEHAPEGAARPDPVDRTAAAIDLTGQDARRGNGSVTSPPR